MVFSSVSFLLIFLPIFLLVYFASPKIVKNYVLLLGSLIFYYVGVKEQVFVMLGVIFLNYAAALLINRIQNKRRLRRLVLLLTLLLSFSVLFYFKYFNFVIGSLISIGGGQFEALDILLPIGISFYLFQTVSYTVDVYRGEVKARKNPLILATYVTMFPQLVAGPIVRYADVETMLDQRMHSFDKAAEGIRRFVIGLSKKVIIANTLAEFSKTVSGMSDKTVLAYWLWAIAFTLTIYFDFSGYSDMAIGLGKILGFDFHENFNYPYLSQNITEFFRRWHISLSTWFRDYLYIPLGGNRKGRVRQIINLVIVWAATGLWHGAAWNFVLWGLLYAFLLIFEKLISKAFQEKVPRVISHIYTLLFVMLGFIVFDSPSLAEAGARIVGLIGIGAVGWIDQASLYLLLSYGFFFLLSMLAATPLLKQLCQKAKGKGKTILAWCEVPFLLVLFLLSLAYVIDSSFNPFIYFRF